MQLKHPLHGVAGVAVAALVVVGAWTQAQGGGALQGGGQGLGVAARADSGQSVEGLPNPYREIEDWERMPAGRRLGAASAIDIERDGRSVWVFERCGGKGASKVVPTTTDNCLGRSIGPLVKFDSSGTVITSFGALMFNYPHGIAVDRDGNIWVTDGQGRDGKGQVVVEISPGGKVMMTLGHAGMAGAGDDMFNQPSDVAVAPNGDIYVADGHGTGNERIVKFSKAGRFITTWGRKGSGPGEFNTPHGLAIDSKGRVFVADRGNSRIQVFDSDGTFIAEWKQFGDPSGIYIDGKDMLYSLDYQQRRGISIGSVIDGRMTAFVPDLDANPEGYVGGREGIAVDRDGDIYISRTGPGGLLKLVKK